MSVERTVMPVVLDEKRWFNSADKAFKHLGLTRTQYRPIRKKLRVDGLVSVQLDGKQYIIERTSD